MATASISGLGSGLDTANIVSQLMQLEAMPQTRLQSRAKSEQYVLSAFQSLNTKLASLATKAGATGAADAWDALKATSSLPGVSVAATSSATPTNFTAKVDRIALSHQLGFSDSAALTDVVTTGSTKVTLDRLDGTSIEVETGDGTLAGLTAALNDPANETGVRATTIKDANGTYRLLVESTATGIDSDFALTNLDGTPLLGGATGAGVRTGQNAQLDLGAGIVVESATNTFTDLMPGVTVTLGANTEVGKSATIAVTRDASTLFSSVKGLVDNINSLLTEIDNGSKYNVETRAKGDFVGDPAIRTIRNELATSLYPGGDTSMAALGLQVDRSGKIVLDEAAFKKAYEADPAAVAAAFGTTGDGFAARVKTISERASDKVDGTLTASINGRTQGIDRLNDSIANWDLRLELRKNALTRQFTALDVALSNMNSQSTWLSGQIASLTPSNN